MDVFPKYCFAGSQNGALYYIFYVKFRTSLSCGLSKKSLRIALALVVKELQQFLDFTNFARSWQRQGLRVYFPYNFRDWKFRKRSLKCYKNYQYILSCDHFILFLKSPGSPGIFWGRFLFQVKGLVGEHDVEVGGRLDWKRKERT